VFKVLSRTKSSLIALCASQGISTLTEKKSYPKINYYKYTQGGFMQFEWDKILKDMVKVFKLSAKELNTISNSPAFKITAFIPYAAGCEDADRCSYTHLASLIMASRLGDFSVSSFRETDLENLNRRLDYVSNFKGGKKDVIKKGMDLLKYNMLLDYKADASNDSKIGKANPISVKTFNIEEELKKVKTELESNPSNDFDSLFSKDALGVVTRGTFWMA
jgi:hypothetical protein